MRACVLLSVLIVQLHSLLRGYTGSFRNARRPLRLGIASSAAFVLLVVAQVQSHAKDQSPGVGRALGLSNSELHSSTVPNESDAPVVMWLVSTRTPIPEPFASDASTISSRSSGGSLTHEIEEGKCVVVALDRRLQSSTTTIRYRESGQPWQYSKGEASQFSIPIRGLAPRTIEVQAIDDNLKGGAIYRLHLTPYLPWYRQMVVRVVAILVLMIGLGAIVTLARRATKIQERQIETERMARRVAEANVAEREKLLRRVSHDLRNPLFVIAGCAEMMEEGQLDQHSALPILNDTVDSMNYLVRQLLSYSRAKSSKRNSDYSLTSIPKLLQSVRDEACVTTRGDKVDFRVECTAGAPEVINVPTQLLKEIIHNLTNNAIKHTNAGQIAIEYSLINGKPTFRITDTGCGMSQETVDNHFKHIFEQESSERSTGFGLGLSICRSLALEIPAEIAVESQLGRGTSVTLTLAESTIMHPVAPEGDIGKSVEQSAEQAYAAGVDPSAGMLPDYVDGILVDDQRSVREALGQRLASINVSVFECPSTSVPDLAKLRPKFVLADLEMQVMSGFDLARRTKQQHPQIFVIAVCERQDLLAKAQACPDFDRVITKASLLNSSTETISYFQQFAKIAPRRPIVRPPRIRGAFRRKAAPRS